jgi:mutator protein MutT
VPCVGAVITDSSGRLLVVRRAHEPGAGRWSIPGGRVEPGETDEQAVMREAREETGLDVSVGRLLGEVEVPGPGVLFRIRDFACHLVGGSLVAGDDAAEARFVDAAELRRLPLVDGLLEWLRRWDVPAATAEP